MQYGERGVVKGGHVVKKKGLQNLSEGPCLLEHLAESNR